jgi:hypothetical protein
VNPSELFDFLKFGMNIEKLRVLLHMFVMYHHHPAFLCSQLKAEEAYNEAAQSGGVVPEST